MRYIALFLLLVSARFLQAPLFGSGEEDFFSDARDVLLIQAAFRNDAKALEAQINAGANVNAIGKGGISPLLFSMKCKNIDAFLLLLNHGANPNYQLADGVPDRNQGLSVMSLSAEAVDSSYLVAALKHGGDPNLVHLRRGTTPIFDAISGGIVENIRILIKNGADVNFQSNRMGMASPLVWAAARTKYDLAYILMDLGADSTLKNATGRSLLEIAKEDLVNGRMSSFQKKWCQKLLIRLEKADHAELPKTEK